MHANDTNSEINNYTKHWHYNATYNDIDNEGTFVWDDGSTSTYTNWADGEPNDAIGNTNCVHTYHTGEWNDGYCPGTAGCFFCSKIGKYINAITGMSEMSEVVKGL